MGYDRQARTEHPRNLSGLYRLRVCFLGIIALVAVLNIVNCISMSVTARIRQYGAMRAVDMDEQQITRMIAAQAFTYALTGCVSGCAVGLPLSRLLYGFLILKHFPYAV